MLSSPDSFRLGSGAKPASDHLPPAKIYLPTLGVSAAWLCEAKEEPYAGQGKRVRRSAAQKAGIAYQRRVGAFLAGGNRHWSLITSPWFAYCDWGGGKRRYCQPDFLLADDSNSTCVIVEVKLGAAAVPLAWWQLEKLYKPVLEKTHRWQTLFSLCISRSYDPSFPAPQTPHFVDDVYSVQPGKFNFLVVK